MPIKQGWKHGIGHADGARPVQGSVARGALFVAMAVRGNLCSIEGLAIQPLAQHVVRRD